MTPQELKNSILQLAIQGKLVEQRPEEGTGEELYQQIQKRKIKKGKPLPEIKEDDKPFDIPRNWYFTRLGNIISLLSGTDFKPEDYNDQQHGIPYITGASSLSETGVTLNRWTDKPTVIAQEGDVLLVCKGSGYGKTVICDIDTAHIARQIMAIQNSDMLNMKFIQYFLMANLTNIKAKGQGVIPGIDRSSVLSMLFPLPPLAEQKRIVAKIDELLPLIDRYEKAWNRLEEFNKRFPDDLQKSLLQMAIQGKLVEQRPEEGTGEELYQQIQEEKQKLIKAGIIKKEKLMPEITEDEKLFDIPSSWKWVRIGKIFNLQAGKNKTSSDIYEEATPEHMYQCFGGNGCRGYVASYNRSGHYAIIGRQGALCGNINYANGNFYATEHAVVVEQFANTDVLWCGYFLKALNLNQYATATAQPGLAVANINQVLFPLPPLAEQRRIVAKLEELLPLCEKLKAIELEVNK